MVSYINSSDKSKASPVQRKRLSRKAKKDAIADMSVLNANDVEKTNKRRRDNGVKKGKEEG